MYVVVAVINQTDLLDDVLKSLVACGIHGATIIDSVGMGRTLVEHDLMKIPLLGRLQYIMNNSRPYNKTIFTVVPNEATLDRAVTAIKAVTGDLSRPGVGLLFAFPLVYVEGLVED